MFFLKKIYEKIVIDYPASGLILVVLITAFFGFHAPNFRLDASSESLALENDHALKYYRSIKERYGSDDYLLITYVPKEGNDLFSAETLSDLQILRDELAALDHIASVTSIIDVPLTQSPPVSLSELNANIRTLESSDMDRGLARKELISSPFYKDLLISDDGQTTALIVALKQDEAFQQLVTKLEKLRELAYTTQLSQQEKTALIEMEHLYKSHNARLQEQQQTDLAAIRHVLKEHADKANLHIGGVPMIVADSIAFIRDDLRNFGLAVLGLLVLLLAVFFRRVQWVLLPMLTCFCVGVCMIGFLAFMNWPVTIVSSNFISLLLIFTLSFCVHQIVRYREFSSKNPDFDQRTLVRATMLNIGVPCFYMVFTTMVAFGSLVVSDIRPIIDFGWMMAFGLGVSFAISFVLMPAALMFLPPEKSISHFDLTGKITQFFAGLVHNHGRIVLTVFVFLIVLSLWGMSFLSVQNRFIDYYKKDTEIYRGMEIIDKKLGGTTPLDIIIDAPQSFLEFQKQEKEEIKAMDDDDFFVSEGPPILEGYWFSEFTIKDAGAIHAFLESLPETGKVLSFYTTIQLLQDLKDSQFLDRFYLGVIYNKLPEETRNLLVTPYISEDGNQLRFSVRVYESREGLNRQELLDKIYNHLTTELGLTDEQIHQTGMVVLYNNILQSLFHSQIMTIWVVFVAMFIMFVILFRNVWMALIATIPNVMITFFVMGVMGWFGIPLDIMTITIAAICLGISADDTIHYIYRFMEEYKEEPDYKKAVERSHASIGRAMYYTSMTIALGFSILAFSSFVPTIYFGILTGTSMIIALLADITLLPLLIMAFKPLGKN